jgi:hypothetical protein
MAPFHPLCLNVATPHIRTSGSFLSPFFCSSIRLMVTNSHDRNYTLLFRRALKPHPTSIQMLAEITLPPHPMQFHLSLAQR